MSNICETLDLSDVSKRCGGLVQKVFDAPQALTRVQRKEPIKVY